MPYISQASIQELSDRLDAVAVVSDYVKLEKRGGRYWACCPFHQEKTGSFTVNPEIKTYYCFGCHKGGTVINFVMEMDKMTFPEAIETLAKRFDVALAYENSGGGAASSDDEAKKKAKEELFELYQRMSGTFQHFLLKKHEAEAATLYIISRGICIEMIERFRLGYAPADRYWLHKFLTGKGYSPEFLAASGLFSSRYPGLSFFSGRLIFPIADRQGRTVAFGGRFLPVPESPAQDMAQSSAGVNTGAKREAPKYINSPESGIYKKGETLYALDLALPEIRRTKTAYIAEGYMDVIALHQAGVTNALAPLGTAFTEEQAKLLRRWAEKVILYFDSDGAGQAAALKGITTCRKNGLVCALVSPEFENNEKEPQENPPESAEPADILSYNEQEAASSKDPADILRFFGPGAAPPKDPADILRFFGPGALQKKAKCFITDFDYLIARAKTMYDTNDLEGKARAVAFIFPYLNLLDSEVARGSCIETAADTFGLLPSVVAEDYRRFCLEPTTGSRSPQKEEDSRLSGGRTGSPIRMNDELSLMIMVAVNYVFPQGEKIFPKFRTTLEINEIEDPNAKELFIALEECIRYGETGMDELLARISSRELKEFLVERSATGEFQINPEQFVADGIKKIRGKRLLRQQEEIIVKLRLLKKNGSGPDGEARELLAEKMRIDNELQLLMQGRQV